MDEAKKKRLFAALLAVLVAATIGASAWYVRARIDAGPLSTAAQEGYASAVQTRPRTEDGDGTSGAAVQKSGEDAGEEPAKKDGEAAADSTTGKDADGAPGEETAGGEAANTGDPNGAPQDGAQPADEGSPSPATSEKPSPTTATPTQPEPDSETELVYVPQPEPEPDPVPTTVTVYVSVDGSPAGGRVRDATVTLDEGATVYDALIASGANVNARGTSYGTYVAAIDGLAEFDHGGMSGWVYAVNGVEPSTACSNYRLSDGDDVVWTYVNVEY